MTWNKLTSWLVGSVAFFNYVVMPSRIVVSSASLLYHPTFSSGTHHGRRAAEAGGGARRWSALVCRAPMSEPAHEPPTKRSDAVVDPSRTQPEGMARPAKPKMPAGRVVRVNVYDLLEKDCKADFLGVRSSIRTTSDQSSSFALRLEPLTTDGRSTMFVVFVTVDQPNTHNK